MAEGALSGQDLIVEAGELVDPDRAGDWNQALMDLGCGTVSTT